MKKFLILFIASLIITILSIIVIVKQNEEQIIENFREQIIDKTNINIKFSKIQLSLFKNFPYSSILLSDTYILYTKEKQPDTLLFAKVLNLKINIINLFQDIYEFPEIIVSDGVINIKSEKIGLLFKNDRPYSSINSYKIHTKRIKIKKCVLNYSYGKDFKLRLHVKNVLSSGTFLSDALALRLSFSIDSLAYRSKSLFFKDNNPISISTIIKEKNDLVYTEDGNLALTGLKSRFTVTYSFKTENLQVAFSSKNLPLNKLKIPSLKKVIQTISQGNISIDSYYSTNINNFNTQKLTLSYSLSDIKLKFNQDIVIKALSGTSTFHGNFEVNDSEISSFSISYSGLDFKGNAKIKGLPRPYLLVDAKVNAKDGFQIPNYKNVTGDINGSLKLLGKLNNFKNLNDSTFKILKLNSSIAISNLSVEKIDFLKNVSGTINLDEKQFSFIGSGILYQSNFTVEVEIPDLLNKFLSKQNYSPKISLELDRVNLDSLLVPNEKDSSIKFSNSYQLKSKVKKLIYKGYELSNLAIGLIYGKGKYDCSNISLNAFSGKIDGRFSYSLNEGMISSIQFQKIDVKSLFKTMNNFNQSIVTDKNISGSLSGNADLSFRYKNDKIDPSSIVATTKILLENGVFSDLTQFDKLAKFLNIKEVEDIHFKTLENNILIDNGMVYIPLMKISSNAINLQLAGQHNFDGKFTYLLKVGLKEILAKKFLSSNIYNSDYEHDNNNGLNLYLKFSGDTENYKFGFDKKSSLDKIKSNFSQEGVTIKNLIINEFNIPKKDSSSVNDQNRKKLLNKSDTISNKTKKNPFKIEWDEIDSTKKF